MSRAVGQEGETMRVLVVEDDPDLSDTLRDSLRIDGFRVDVVPNGAQVLPLVGLIDYDVVVLDRDLPGMHGDTVCRELVARRVPARILMLTAAGGIDDRVTGLDLGADDYLAKPFAYPELVARIRSLVRRSGSPAGAIITFGRARLNTIARTLQITGKPVTLTPKEYDVLECLVLANGNALSTERLLAAAWDEPFERTLGAVRVVIHSLRPKVAQGVKITHVPGRGYRAEPA